MSEYQYHARRRRAVLDKGVWPSDSDDSNDDEDNEGEEE